MDGEESSEQGANMSRYCRCPGRDVPATELPVSKAVAARCDECLRLRQRVICFNDYSEVRSSVFQSNSSISLVITNLNALGSNLLLAVIDSADRKFVSAVVFRISSFAIWLWSAQNQLLAISFVSAVPMNVIIFNYYFIFWVYIAPL